MERLTGLLFTVNIVDHKLPERVNTNMYVQHATYNFIGFLKL